MSLENKITSVLSNTVNYIKKAVQTVAVVGALSLPVYAQNSPAPTKNQGVVIPKNKTSKVESEKKVTPVKPPVANPQVLHTKEESKKQEKEVPKVLEKTIISSSYTTPRHPFDVDHIKYKRDVLCGAPDFVLTPSTLVNYTVAPIGFGVKTTGSWILRLGSDKDSDSLLSDTFACDDWYDVLTKIITVPIGGALYLTGATVQYVPQEMVDVVGASQLRVLGVAGIDSTTDLDSPSLRFYDSDKYGKGYKAWETLKALVPLGSAGLAFSSSGGGGRGRGLPSSDGGPLLGNNSRLAYNSVGNSVEDNFADDVMYATLDSRIRKGISEVLNRDKKINLGVLKTGATDYAFKMPNTSTYGIEDEDKKALQMPKQSSIKLNGVICSLKNFKKCYESFNSVNRSSSLKEKKQKENYGFVVLYDPARSVAMVLGRDSDFGSSSDSCVVPEDSARIRFSADPMMLARHARDFSDNQYASRLSQGRRQRKLSELSFNAVNKARKYGLNFHNDSSRKVIRRRG